jgi:hypothetical protein
MKIELALSRDDKETVIVESKKMLSIIDHTTEELMMSGWIHMPKYSEEYKYNQALCGNYEAFAHIRFAMGSLDGSDDSNKVAIGHLKKARAIFNLLGMIDEAQQMDTMLSLCTFNDFHVAKSSMSQTIRNSYERNLQKRAWIQ